MRLLRRRRPEPRYIHRAEKFMAAAASASRRLGHDYIGTEHVLLALADDRETTAAQALARRGLTAERIETEIMTLVGPCPTPPPRLDRDSLATLGIDLNEVRHRVEQAFGPDALNRGWAGSIPVLPRLKRAFELAAREAGDAAPISPQHMLLGLAGVDDSIAATILRACGILAEEIRAELGNEPPV